jgi:ketosteroid isomerase-like protein
MTNYETGTPIEPGQLPEIVTNYLAAHRAHDVDVAIQSYAPDAVVIDDGNTYAGVEAIRAWLARSSTEYKYTIEITAATRFDETHFVATHHLTGNFPGGQVDLDYRFALSHGRIDHLTIEQSAKRP